MLKKLLLAVVACWLIMPAATACDVCHLFEYNNRQLRNYVALFYQYRVFNGYQQLQMPASFTAPGTARNQRTLHEPENNGFFVNKHRYDFETYQTLELRGHFMLGQNWQLSALMPYEKSTVYYREVVGATRPMADSTFSVQGWGNVTLALGRNWQLYASGTQRHIITPGVGVVLPTGAYRQTDMLGNPHDPVIQPGTGAWAFLARLNYLYTWQQWGFSAGGSYKWNTEGGQDYAFGNSLNVFGTLYRQWAVGSSLVLVPQVGLYAEQAAADALRGNEQPLTGGSVLFATGGLDVNWQNLTLTAQYQSTLAEDLNGNQLGNAGRLTLGLLYNFGAAAI